MDEPMFGLSGIHALPGTHTITVDVFMRSPPRLLDEHDTEPRFGMIGDAIKEFSDELTLLTVVVSEAMLALMVVWTELFKARRLAFAVVSPPFSVDAEANKVVIFEPWLLTVFCRVAMFVWIVVILDPWEISVALSVATLEKSEVMLDAAMPAEDWSDAIELFCVPSAAVRPEMAIVLAATLLVSVLMLWPCDVVWPCKAEM